jgi:hypothetical protein
MAAQPSAPWWATLLSIFLTAIVSILGTLYAIRGIGVPGAPQAPSGIMGVIKDTIGYLPHIMLLFGVVADAITQDGVYSIASLIGVFSIGLNYLFGFFWTALGDSVEGIRALVQGARAAAAPGVPAGQADLRGGGRPGDFSGNYDGCEVQGFSFLHSKYAPQTLVVTATIFSYYIFDVISNRGWANSAGVLSLFIPLYLFQVFMIGECNPEELGRVWKSIIAALEGMFIGGTSYAVVQAYYPNRLPSSAMSIFPRKTASDLSPGPNGTMVDSAGNPYVCMPNGQCVPDLSSMEARKNFAQMAGETLGTGAAAVPADCPARPSASPVS